MIKSHTKKHIFLNGFMGSGKSKIGPLLAERLKCSFFDLDVIIETVCGKKISAVFKTEGEAVFRKKEQAVLFQLIDQNEKSVIAVGGGALINEENKKKVDQSGTVVYLKSAPKAIFNRVKHTSKRPLLQVPRDEHFESNLINKITELLNKRSRYYESAQIIIERDGLEAEQVADAILERLIEKEQ